MKYIFTILLLAITIIGNSQTIDRSVVSSNGDHFANGSAQLSITIGEVVTETVSNGTNELTQGFHQTNIVITNIEDHESNVEMNIFPNPTMESITIKLKELENGLTITMHTIEGKVLLNKKVNALETKLNLNAFAKGTYFVNVLKAKKLVKTFKILKQ